MTGLKPRWARADGAALQRATRWTYIVAGIASLVLAVFSLALPHTPPKKAEAAEDKFAWLEALRLLGRPFVLVLWIVTFVDSFVINAYFYWAATFLGSPQVGIKGNWIMPIMSIGQVAEILAMAILAVTLKKLGWRTTMVIGILGACGALRRFRLFPAMDDADHSGLHFARHLLRVLFRHGLYFRG